MPRTKTGARRRARHKKVLKLAKGYWGQRGRVYARAKETVIRALAYAYQGRKKKKRDFRRLWILRINAAARQNGVSYSNFIHGLKLAGVDIDRKVLADMAVNNPDAFSQIITLAKNTMMEVQPPSNTTSIK
jgi:large subunit ribosomal protein L20